MQYCKRGFTLLELLLVVAIIGILLSVVIIIVGKARQKAWDKGVEANLVQVRQVAAYIYNENDNYSDLCRDGTLNASYSQLDEIRTEVEKRNGRQEITCYALGERYCVESPLVSGKYFCVDYTGRAIEIPSSRCDSANYDCL